MKKKSGEIEAESMWEGEWLTLEEACSYMRISRQTINRLMKSGELKPNGRMKKRWRFRKANLDAFLENGILPNCDNMERSAGEVGHADKKIPAENYANTGNFQRRPGKIFGARKVERQKNGPEEEDGKSGGDVRRSGRPKGRSKGQRRASKEAFSAAVRRLRRVVAEETRPE